MCVNMCISCKVVDSVNDIKRLRCFCSVFVTQSVLEHTTKQRKEKRRKINKLLFTRPSGSYQLISCSFVFNLGYCLQVHYRYMEIKGLTRSGCHGTEGLPFVSHLEYQQIVLKGSLCRLHPTGIT